MKTIEKTTDHEVSAGNGKLRHRWLYDTEFDHYDTLCGMYRKKRKTGKKADLPPCVVCKNLYESGHWIEMIKDLDLYIKLDGGP